MTTAAARTLAPTTDPSAGGRLVAADGRALPMAAAALSARAGRGLCRATLTQVFRNVHAEPLAVTYLFPLPHDGAVSGFAFTLDGRRTVGEVDRVASARERYEEAILEGRTAALVEQVRGSVFTQSLGNLPPGAEVRVELTVDQRLAWLPEGAWEWRFPTAVAPRYQGAPGRTADAARLTVDVADGPLPARLTLALDVEDGLAAGGAVTSPSHPLHLVPAALGPGWRAGLAAEQGAPLDRDVVVRWPVAGAEVGLALAAAASPAGARTAGRAFGLITVVPPAPRAVRPLPRDLIVLLDTSGSMGGRPLDQARAVVGALVDSLGDQDRLELIEFSSAPRRWNRKPVAATAANRAKARAWLAALEAGGSTEMTEALTEALSPLREDAQRQVVLVTDGEIGFEQEIVAGVLDRLPAGSRLHTVGVGSAVNRSLTGPAARAGRGVEVVLGLDEDPAEGARRLLARTVAPVVTELALSGSAMAGPRAALARWPDLFAGAPALLPVVLRKEGGELVLRGRTADGPFERVLQVPAAAALAPDDGALAALYAREAVELLELQAAAGRGRRVDAAIERLGLQFQIATRLTAWLAISAEATVDPRQPTRREVMPQQLPHGMSVAGLGLRAAPAMVRSGAAAEMMALSAKSVAYEEDDLPRAAPSAAGGRKKERRIHAAFSPPAPPPPAAEARKPAAPLAPRPPPARLLVLAARLVLLKALRLVLEATVEDGGLDWAPGDAVTVELDDGTVVSARVHAAATTGPGRLAPGAVLRLALDLGDQLPPDRSPRAALVGGGVLLLRLSQP